jgi:hypothetical protein
VARNLLVLARPELTGRGLLPRTARVASGGQKPMPSDGEALKRGPWGKEAARFATSSQARRSLPRPAGCSRRNTRSCPGLGAPHPSPGHTTHISPRRVGRGRCGGASVDPSWGSAGANPRPPAPARTRSCSRTRRDISVRPGSHPYGRRCSARLRVGLPGRRVLRSEDRPRQSPLPSSTSLRFRHNSHHSSRSFGPPRFAEHRQHSRSTGRTGDSVRLPTSGQTQRCPQTMQ